MYIARYHYARSKKNIYFFIFQTNITKARENNILGTFSYAMLFEDTTEKYREQ